jgi:hypothetical protein
MTTNPELEDVPFEVRAALYSMCLAKDAQMPLTKAVEKLRMSAHYQTMWSQIRGVQNLTPNTLMLLCIIYGDFTPLQILMAHHEVPYQINEPHDHTKNLLLEISEASAEVGKVNALLADALRDRKITANERVRIAEQALEAIRQLQDVIETASRTKVPDPLQSSLRLI